LVSIPLQGANKLPLQVAPVLFEIEPNARYASTDLRQWEVFTRAGVQLSRTLSIEFQDMDPGMKMEGVGPSGAILSVYHGNDPAQWRPHIASYEAVAYRGLYPGIDVVYHRTENGLKGDFIVRPGADPERIRFRFTGGKTLLSKGELDIHPNDGGKNMIERIPSVYEVDGAGDKWARSGRYRQYPDGSVGFEVSGRDPQRELVIDPNLTFSSFVAGSSLDQVTAMAYSAFDKTLVVGGWTESSDLLGVGDASNFKGSIDGFYGRFAVSTAGVVTLTSMTLIGGSGTDKVLSIGVSSSGVVAIGGSTTSQNFPVSSVAPTRWKKLQGTSDGFMAIFAASGTSLLFSSYFGGTGADQITAITIDPTFSIYIAGTTSSRDLPVLRDTPGYSGGQTDGFVGVINADLSVRYLRYVGGAGTDSISSLAMLNGELYVTGGTDSVDLATVNPFTSGFFSGAVLGGGQDAFVMKVNATGTVVYCSYLGGNGGYTGAPEMGNAIAVNPAGEAYVTGVTSSTNFPATSGGFQTQAAAGYGAVDAFLTKFTATGGLGFSTYLGGTSWDQANAITVLKTGFVAVAGMTTSYDFPTLTPMQSTIGSNGSYDGFVSIFTPAGKLAYSSFFGGAGSDAVYAMATNSNSDLFIGGLTTSLNLPKVNALQTYISSSGYHGFLAKFTPVQQVGVFRPSTKQWILSNDFNFSTYSIYSWGALSCANPQPVVGDWDSTGWTRIGMYCDGTWYLDMDGDNLYTAGVDRLVTNFGFTATKPVVGDWDNTGKVRLGFFQNGLWYLDLVGDYVLRYNSQSVFSFGGAGDFPIVGDWLNNGLTHLGIVRFNHFLLDLNGDRTVDTNYNFGSSTDIFMFADWYNTGVKRIGSFRTQGYPIGWWFVDINGNNNLDNGNFPCVPDGCFSQGASGDIPVVGVRGSWRF